MEILTYVEEREQVIKKMVSIAGKSTPLSKTEIHNLKILLYQMIYGHAGSKMAQCDAILAIMSGEIDADCLLSLVPGVQYGKVDE